MKSNLIVRADLQFLGNQPIALGSDDDWDPESEEYDDDDDWDPESEEYD